MKKKSGGRLKRWIKTILIVGVVLFVLLLIVPLDEETMEAETVQGGQEENGIFPEGLVDGQRLELKGGGNDVATVLVYMNGSDLESDSGEATTDICEMLAAGVGQKVNVLVETLGTREWSDRLGIASDRTQRYKVEGSSLVLVDDSLGQLDCTETETLSDFIRWGAENYPADRYMLILWDHGAGPVYGFGYDEHQSDETTLTIDEIQTAVKRGGVYFDFIGMDCCIMSSLELCCAMYDYCDYMILSEDFESGLGWSYTGWLKALSDNTSIPTTQLGRRIVDDMIADNEEYGGLSSTLALIDQSYMKLLYKAWIEFAYANESTLLGENYSMHIKGGNRAHPCLRERGLLFDWIFGEDGSYSMSDYYITDIMALAQNIESPEAEALEAALGLVIEYFGCTSDEVGMTGLSVTLPYGDPYFYESLTEIFLNVGMDKDYVDWLGGFVYASGMEDYYDYDPWYEDDWGGWDDYSDDFDWFEWLDDWLDWDEEDDWWYEDDSDWYDYGWDCYDYSWDEGCYEPYDPGHGGW